MATFEEYSRKYQTVRMERQDGILQITFHSDGGPLQWGAVPHEEFPQAFHDIGSDPDNRVVIMTGTGDASRVQPPRLPPVPKARLLNGTGPTGMANNFCGTCWTSRCR